MILHDAGIAPSGPVFRVQVQALQRVDVHNGFAVQEPSAYGKSRSNDDIRILRTDHRRLARLLAVIVDALDLAVEQFLHRLHTLDHRIANLGASLLGEPSGNGGIRHGEHIAVQVFHLKGILIGIKVIRPPVRVIAAAGQTSQHHGNTQRHTYGLLNFHLTTFLFSSCVRSSFSARSITAVLSFVAVSSPGLRLFWSPSASRSRKASR